MFIRHEFRVPARSRAAAVYREAFVQRGAAVDTAVGGEPRQLWQVYDLRQDGDELVVKVARRRAGEER